MIIFRKLFLIYRVLFQIIAIGVLTVTGFLLLQLKWPGFRVFTDNDAGIIYWTSIIFITSSLILFFNTLLFIVLNHWRKYRYFTVFYIIILLFLFVLPREYFVKLVLGNEKVSFTTFSDEYIYMKLRLFKTGEFLSENTDYELTIENTGRYSIKNNKLSLNFYQKEIGYMSSQFTINNDTLTSNDDTRTLKLVKDNILKQDASLNKFQRLNPKALIENIFN